MILQAVELFSYDRAIIIFDTHKNLLLTIGKLINLIIHNGQENHIL